MKEETLGFVKEDNLETTQDFEEIENDETLVSEKIECLIDKGFCVGDETQEKTVVDGLQSQHMDYKQNVVLESVKFDDLISQIQDLRKQKSILSDEVRGISEETFPGVEIVGALKLLGAEYDTLKNKYLKECVERKKLYNEVIDLKGNIRVFCRCRPLNKGEIAAGSSSVVECSSSVDNELQILCADSSKKQFKFDHVFGPRDDQESVFSQISPLATSVMDGYNVCIFAYGQTGTGKTFTMEGTPENRGVNYRTLEEIFRISKERSGLMKYELCVSMLEVYNEKIRDLLTESSNLAAKKLEIKQSADGTQEVPGLHEACVHSVDDVWEQLKTGGQNRAVGSTSFNELSSRSHCLFRVTVRGENLVNGQRTKSHLWLVDLAGSERIGRTEVEGERLKESQFINKSLSALGDVVSALASKTAHIPYRNSKLTHLLQSSLGGDCKTLMFVQISPSSSDLGETLCSLNFASRVRGVEHGPAHKQADHHEMFKYKQMAEKQKQQDEKEIWKLQNSLQLLQLRFASQEQHCRSLQQKTKDLEAQLAEERKSRIHLENKASASSFSYQNKTAKPPMGPSSSMIRQPLRGITNLAPVPEMSSKIGSGKENNAKKLMQPRRVSIAMRPPQPSSSSSQLHQPRRRVSIATMPSSKEGPPANSSSARNSVRQPRRRVSIATTRPEPQLFNSTTMTPQNNTNKFQISRGSFKDRLSLARDARRISRLFSPMPNFSGKSSGEITPVNRRSSPGRSWKPTNPTVVALHKRHFVWSPLKEKVQKRKASLPPRSSDYWK